MLRRRAERLQVDQPKVPIRTRTLAYHSDTISPRLFDRNDLYGCRHRERARLRTKEFNEAFAAVSRRRRGTGSGSSLYVRFSGGGVYRTAIQLDRRGALSFSRHSRALYRYGATRGVICCPGTVLEPTIQVPLRHWSTNEVALGNVAP